MFGNCSCADRCLTGLRFRDGIQESEARSRDRLQDSGLLQLCQRPTLRTRNKAIKLTCRMGSELPAATLHLGLARRQKAIRLSVLKWLYSLC